MYFIHSSWIGPVTAASAAGLMAIAQVADLGLFALSATVRRVVWLAAAAAWLMLLALVILRFLVIG
jgi:hypothetical protein